jgi:outer membrane immunogenic protein
MKQFLLGSVALAAMFAGPAMAADLRVPPPPPPVVYYDWSGAYIGFNVGGVWADVDRTFPSPFSGVGTAGGLGPMSPGGLTGFTTNRGDGIYGFHAGAQWQWGAWVLGGEAALSGCFDECRSESGLLSPGVTANTIGEHKITNLFTAGGKLGYAWDRWMLYANGGFASADLKGTYCALGGVNAGLCGPAVTAQNGATRADGWYAGGGLDFMVHKGSLVDVLLGVEYQHFDVSNSNGDQAFCAPPNCGVPNRANYDLSAKGDLVRAKLTIKTQGYGWFPIWTR